MRFVNNPFTDKLDVGSLTGSGAPPVETVTGNDGIAVGPDVMYNLNLLGNNTQGINVTGNAGTSTLTIAGIDATTTQKGVLETATNAEAAAQSSSTVALTPSNITSLFSTTYLPSSQGGTGLSSPAAHSLIATNGSSAYSVLGVAGNGQIPIGSIGSNPVLANIASADSSITITNGPGTIDLSVATPAFYSVTPYIVGPVGRAPYQTIQAGVNAANAGSGGIVVVQPGTYTENLTLYSNCHVMGLDFADAGGGVIINGVHTPPASGGFVFNNVQLESATHVFSSAVAGTTHLIIANAAIVVTNGFTFNLPNWTGKLEAYDVNDRGSTNDGFINNTGGSQIAIFSSAIGAGTGNTMVVSGAVSIFTCAVSCPINITTGATAYLEYNVHTGSITLSGDSTGEIVGCEVDAQITMSSNSAWLISLSTINTSSNPSIAGSGIGALTLSDVTYINNSTVSGTLTVTNVGLTDLGSIRSNFTAHSILLGQGTRGTITALGAATNGQIPIGSTGADPVLAGITAGTGISVTNGAGSISIATNGSSTVNTLTGNTGGAISPTLGNINTVGTGSITVAGSGSTLTSQLTGLTNHNVLIGAGTATITNVAPSATSGVPLISQGASADPTFGTAVVAGGGTGAVSFTTHSLILGQGTSAMTALGAATNGQIPVGSTGADPVLATITAGTNTSVTNGAGTITIGASQAVVANNYSVANATPYVAAATDYYITVDTSTIAITIQLPDAPTNYRTFIIKDSAGNASVRNVTVTTVSGIKLLDGAATFVMNTNYQAAQFLYDGFGYQVF